MKYLNDHVKNSYMGKCGVFKCYCRLKILVSFSISWVILMRTQLEQLFFTLMIYIVLFWSENTRMEIIEINMFKINSSFFTSYIMNIAIYQTNNV